MIVMCMIQLFCIWFNSLILNSSDDSHVQREKKLYYSNVTVEEQNNALRKKIAEVEESISQTTGDGGLDANQLKRELKEGYVKIILLIISY
jgi:hypothetical protein